MTLRQELEAILSELNIRRRSLGLKEEQARRVYKALDLVDGMVAPSERIPALRDSKMVVLFIDNDKERQDLIDAYKQLHPDTKIAKLDL